MNRVCKIIASCKGNTNYHLHLHYSVKNTMQIGQNIQMTDSFTLKISLITI